jgi:hypothetical protein
VLNQSVQDRDAVTAYLARRLSEQGFDVHVRSDGDMEVGSANRGPAAPVATIHLGGLLAEYLEALGSGDGGRGEVGPEQAAGRLLTQLIESFDAVHDPEDNNLTARVFLRRSGAGHVVLDEERAGSRPADVRGTGHLQWSADRP